MIITIRNSRSCSLFSWYLATVTESAISLIFPDSRRWFWRVCFTVAIAWNVDIRSRCRVYRIALGATIFALLKIGETARLRVAISHAAVRRCGATAFSDIGLAEIVSRKLACSETWQKTLDIKSWIFSSFKFSRFKFYRAIKYFLSAYVYADSYTRYKMSKRFAKDTSKYLRIREIFQTMR